METVTKGRNESQWELWWLVVDTVTKRICGGHREM